MTAKTVFALALTALPILAFAFVPENQSDGERYEEALRSTRCAQLLARSAPDWFKRGFVYQIQSRAFTSEGTLKAATAKLPLVRESGAGIVYLMPVNVLDDETNQLSRIWRELGQPKGFYRTKDYFNTDPEFGTNADRKDFVDECHRLGMKVIFDIVLYHCGPSAVLIKKNPNWVERNPDGSIRLGKWGRPVLNFRESGLREYLYALLGYLVADVGVDGFRCDIAETQPLDFWEEAHRRLSAIKSDVVLICEGYGCPGEQEKAFDCCYDWKGMEALRGALDGRVPLSRVREEWAVKRRHCERGARFLRYVENHDETDASQNKGPRGDSDERWGRKRMEAALFYCFTSDGVPFLYNGNEFADRSFQRMLLKTPIDWAIRDTQEGRERLAFVQRLARLRQTDSAFSTDATLTWIDNDCPDAVLSYVKQAPGSAWLCVVNLSKSARKVAVSGHECYDLAAGEWKMIPLKNKGCSLKHGGDYDRTFMDEVVAKAGASVPDDYRCEYSKKWLAGKRRRGIVAMWTFGTNDFSKIADWGCNLVRMSRFRPLEDDYAKLEENLMVLKERDVRVIFAPAAPGGKGNRRKYAIFNDDGMREDFLKGWERLARHFKGRDEIWAFDLLNEPFQSLVSDPNDKYSYWQLEYEAIQRIRAIDPDRPIIATADGGTSPGEYALNLMRPFPFKDIWYEIHFYSPLDYTHYEVIGKNLDLDKPTQTYPGLSDARGEVWNKATLEAVFDRAKPFAEKYGARFCVGEFSVMRRMPGGDRWLDDVCDICDKVSDFWTYHSYGEYHGWNLEYDETSPFEHPCRVPLGGESARMKILKKHWREAKITCREKAL